MKESKKTKDNRDEIHEKHSRIQFIAGVLNLWGAPPQGRCRGNPGEV
jgi:hypothetical protein